MRSSPPRVAPKYSGICSMLIWTCGKDFLTPSKNGMSIEEGCRALVGLFVASGRNHFGKKTSCKNMYSSRTGVSATSHPLRWSSLNSLGCEMVQSEFLWLWMQRAMLTCFTLDTSHPNFSMSKRDFDAQVVQKPQQFLHIHEYSLSLYPAI
jgi:hypothetical protein